MMIMAAVAVLLLAVAILVEEVPRAMSKRISADDEGYCRVCGIELDDDDYEHGICIECALLEEDLDDDIDDEEDEYFDDEDDDYYDDEDEYEEDEEDDEEDFGGGDFGGGGSSDEV